MEEIPAPIWQRKISGSLGQVNDHRIAEPGLGWARMQRIVEQSPLTKCSGEEIREGEARAEPFCAAVQLGRSLALQRH